MDWLQQGDSGAWVIRRTDNSLLGHIIAISGLLGYVIPISQTLDDMETAIGSNIVVQMPSPFQHLAELAKRTYKSAHDVETKDKALRIAHRAIQEDVMGMSLPSQFKFLTCTIKSGWDSLLLAELLCIVGADWQEMLDEHNWNTAERQFGSVMNRRELLARLKKAVATDGLKTPGSQGSKDDGLDKIHVKFDLPHEHDSPSIAEKTDSKDHPEDLYPSGNRVGWDAEDDPENPKNWSFWTKWLQICLLIVPVFTS
ncbi:hypothetical protein DPSP01_000581 [Paraphaeosphaeria sporulosa]